MCDTMDVLLSIRPFYVKEILQGTKKYEYRKVLPKNIVNRYYIYESSPAQRIVGYFTCQNVLSDTPMNIWNQTCKYGGISYLDYQKYFRNRDSAYALKIDAAYFFSTPVNPWIYDKFYPPQSFIYLKEGTLHEKLCSVV